MASARSTNHKPRRVDFFAIDEDYEAAFLGSLGFSTRCIQGRTKLSPGQITYRLRKAAIRRVDYRDGTSEIATMVMRLQPQVDKQLVHHLRETLLK
jgi:hypothetical protein